MKPNAGPESMTLGSRPELETKSGVLNWIARDLAFSLSQLLSRLLSSPSVIISSLWFKVRDVRLSSTWTLRDDCKIINWPHFNIVVSENREIQREGEKWGNGQLVEQSEHPLHLFDLTRYLIWVWFVMSHNSYNLSIKDH